MTWSQEQLTILINEFQKFPCLYAVKNKYYKNKYARNGALSTILNVVQKAKPGVNLLGMKTKLNELKSNLTAEHEKVVASQRSGCGTDDIYRPQLLWYYNLISFVLEHNKPRPAFDSIQIEKRTEDDQNIFMEDNSDILPSAENGVPTLSGCEAIADGAFLAVVDAPLTDDGSPLTANETPSASNRRLPPRKRKHTDGEQPPPDVFLYKASTALTTITEVMEKHLLKNSVFGNLVNEKLNQIKNNYLRIQAEIEITQILYNYVKRSRE